MLQRLNRGWPNYVRQHRQTAESWILNIAPVGFVYRPKGEKRAKVDFNYCEKFQEAHEMTLGKIQQKLKTWGLLNGSEDEAETRGKHSQENLSFISMLTLGIKLHTHPHTHIHTSDPVQKNIYRQCTRGYIYIYIVHLDYLQERKRQPFLRKYKDSNFSLFCEALILMQNSCTAEPEHQFCTQTRDKTNNSIWHARTPSNIHTYIRTTWPTTTYSYKYTSKLQCSTKFEQMVPVAAGKLKKRF